MSSQESMIVYSVWSMAERSFLVSEKILVPQEILIYCIIFYAQLQLTAEHTVFTVMSVGSSMKES